MVALVEFSMRRNRRYGGGGGVQNARRDRRCEERAISSCVEPETAGAPRSLGVSRMGRPVLIAAGVAPCAYREVCPGNERRGENISLVS